MEEAASQAVVEGLGLGGVLAVAAAWSRATREGLLPHLGIGGLAAVAIALGARLPGSAPAVLVGVMVAGAGLARLGLVLDQRAGADRQAPPLLSDVALLGAAVALVGVLAPAGVAAAGWPLGGTPGPAGGLGALAVGAMGAVLLARAGVVPLLPRWSLAGASLAGSALLAAGFLTPGGATPALAADPTGLALRAAAAGLAGRGSPREAAIAGFGIGLAEALVRAADPSGATALLPALGVALLAVLTGDPGRVPSGEQGSP